MRINIRPKSDNDFEWINTFLIKEWCSDFIVTAQLKKYKPIDLPGLIAEKKVKL